MIELVDHDEIQRGISPDFKDAFIVDDQIIQKCLLEKDFIFGKFTFKIPFKAVYDVAFLAPMVGNVIFGVFNNTQTKSGKLHCLPKRRAFQTAVFRF